MGNCFQRLGKLKIHRTNPPRPTPAQGDIKRRIPTVTEQQDEVVALYDFEPRDEGDLGFAQGDRLRIINRHVPNADGWWNATHLKNGKSGVIPSNFVTALKNIDHDFSAELWWFDMDRRSAKRQLILPANPRGTFLVRKSKDANKLSLLVKNFDEAEDEIAIKHYHINVILDANGKTFRIGPRNVFPTLQELIAHYQVECGGLCCKLMQPCPKEPQTIPFKDFEVKPGDIKLLGKLGAGKFGEVWKAKYKLNFDVAVKKMLPGKMSKEAFLGEARMIHQVHHRRLIQLMGVVSESDPILIVLEFVENGTLLNYIQKDKGQKVQFKDILDFAAQVAEGMAYLEEHRYIHRDLRATNILVGKGNSIKIADFGLARVLLEDEEYSLSDESKFPIKWSAPETLEQRKFTIKSDVWSYGIFLYELVTYGQMPYSGMTNYQVILQIKDGYRLPNPDQRSPYVNCPSKMYETMLSCWATQEKGRPTFEYLNKFFDDYYTEAEGQYVRDDFE